MNPFKDFGLCRILPDKTKAFMIDNVEDDIDKALVAVRVWSEKQDC